MLHRIKEENEFKKVTDAMSVLFKGHVDRGHTVWLETRAGFLAVVCARADESMTLLRMRTNENLRSSRRGSLSRA